MSGQYPGGYNSPLGGHRGQFNAQQQQQQQMMSPMNQMGQMGGAMGNQGGGIMPMGGYHPQQQMSGGMGGMGGGVGVMSSGMSPSHIQQQLPQMGPNMMGAAGPGTVMSAGGNLMQQQHLQQQQMSSGIAQQQQQQSQVQGGQGTIGVLHQQQQTAAQTTPGGTNMLAMSQPNPHKEINIVALSRLGQETVQDITSRFQEIFTALKIVQPTANRDNNTEKKVQEYFRTIRLLFKRVRIIYEKCNDGYPQGMEYTQVESLIPYKDESDHRFEPTQCEEYRKALQENQELIETVKLKNRQLREIIDRTRIIIWEINTMLSMRRS